MKADETPNVITNKIALLEKIIHGWNPHLHMQERVQPFINSIQAQTENFESSKGRINYI